MIEPILYILMRNDLDSLNCGKAAAQATHAASDFEQNVLLLPENDTFSQCVLEGVSRWRGNRTFGTTIVLEARWPMIENVITFIDNNDINVFCRIIHDPTYPIRDGEVTHLIPLNTCAWIFGDKEVLQPYLYDLELMK